MDILYYFRLYELEGKCVLKKGKEVPGTHALVLFKDRTREEEPEIPAANRKRYGDKIRDFTAATPDEEIITQCLEDHFSAPDLTFEKIGQSQGRYPREENLPIPFTTNILKYYQGVDFSHRDLPVRYGIVIFGKDSKLARLCCDLHLEAN